MSLLDFKQLLVDSGSIVHCMHNKEIRIETLSLCYGISLIKKGSRAHVEVAVVGILSFMGALCRQSGI